MVPGIAGFPFKTPEPTSIATIKIGDKLNTLFRFPYNGEAFSVMIFPLAITVILNNAVLVPQRLISIPAQIVANMIWQSACPFPSS